MKRLTRILFVLTAILSIAVGEVLQVQTKASASNADVGEVGYDVYKSALISVLILRDGKGYAGAGSSRGNGWTRISLPTGWDFDTNLVPPGGGTLIPTAFSNRGDGYYFIRVNSPYTGWKSGKYHYKVSFQDNSRMIYGAAIEVLEV